MTLFTDRGPSLSGTKTATFRADALRGIGGVPQGL